MKKIISDDILENQASLLDNGIKDNSDNLCCDELYLFDMQDNYHEFSIGLTTVLDMLAMAEAAGAVPKLSPEWWNEAKGRLV